MPLSLDLGSITDPAARRAFERLVSSAVDTGGRQISLRAGQAAIAWPGGSATSSTLTVNHGLPGAPLAFVFFMVDQTGTGPCYARGYSSTTTQITADFVTGGFTPAAGNHGTAGWIALG